MIINYALTVILLVLLTGIGIDTGLMKYHQTQLAACAKAAAVSMTMATQRNFSAANITLAGQVTAQLNGFTNNVNGVTLAFETPPSAGLFRRFWSSPSSSNPVKSQCLYGHPRLWRFHSES